MNLYLRLRCSPAFIAQAGYAGKQDCHEQQRQDGIAYRCELRVIRVIAAIIRAGRSLARGSCRSVCRRAVCPYFIDVGSVGAARGHIGCVIDRLHGRRGSRRRRKVRSAQSHADDA